MKLLEESGYNGPRHFDAHAYRTKSDDGVWDFARGCMRTYLILKEKARQFRQDPEIQTLLWKSAINPLTSRSAVLPRRRPPQRSPIRSRGTRRARPALQRLDQLLIELLLAVPRRM